MRWYIAGSFTRQKEFLEYRERLMREGEEVQARWITDHTDSTKHPTDEMRATDAIHDLEDITKSDGIINFTETNPSSKRARGGRHVEFGIGLALNKRMVIIGTQENVFHYLPSVELYSSFEAFMEEGLT